MPKRDDRQLQLPLHEAPKLRVIQGLGQKKAEKLVSRDAVARVLMGAGADLLLKRISPERAEVIEKAVDEILTLFDRVDGTPILMSVLNKKIEALEVLVRETEERKAQRRR